MLNRIAIKIENEEESMVVQELAISLGCRTNNNNDIREYNPSVAAICIDKDDVFFLFGDIFEDYDVYTAQEFLEKYDNCESCDDYISECDGTTDEPDRQELIAQLHYYQLKVNQMELEIIRAGNHKTMLYNDLTFEEIINKVISKITKKMLDIEKQLLK